MNWKLHLFIWTALYISNKLNIFEICVQININLHETNCTSYLAKSVIVGCANIG